MKKVVVSCGPIPARLDSVKFITNKFKGGLAFATAEYLSKYFEVTIVKWVHTTYKCENSSITIVNILDVMEYYKWFEENASKYDAFVMAGAVANLMPSEPYEGKFPSHKYTVGEKFNIEYEIAPRAIDLIKQLNPRCCLIGYKLFDASTDEELIEIAKHTLKDSKANVIFANTPAKAKEKKIALLQDGSTIPMNFEKHLAFMKQCIEATYCKTIIKEPIMEYEREAAIVNMIDKTFDGFGTVAVRVPGTNMLVTTGRGHKGGAVLVESVSLETKEIISTGKATLNAPLLFTLMQELDCDYIMHRHEQINAPTISYQMACPGSIEEARVLARYMKDYRLTEINIQHHGYIRCLKYASVDWQTYYEEFPSNYFSTPKAIEEELEKYKGKATLEVGGNKQVSTKFALDPYVQAENAINITWDELDGNGLFDLIVLKNSINYLSKDQIKLLKEALDKGGTIIANTFLKAPALKQTANEVAYLSETGEIHHTLFDGKDKLTKHWFYAYDRDFWDEQNFCVVPYGRNSAIIKYMK